LHESEEKLISILHKKMQRVISKCDKKTLLALFIVFSTLCSFSQFNNKEAKLSHVQNLIHEYSPEASKIIKYLDKNNFNYSRYLKNAHTEGQLLFYTAILVHETTHAYGLVRMEELLKKTMEDTNVEFSQKEYSVNFFFSMAAGALQKGIIKNYEYTYISDTIDLLMNDCIQFCENEITTIVPQSTLETLYRHPYMEGCKRFGIYSYIEEMSANLQTVKAGLEIMPYMLKKLDKTNDVTYLKALLFFLTNIDAYYDFRLLIAWHLQYAEEYHNDIFKELSGNKNLRVTYSLLCNQYEEIEPKIIRAVENIENKYFSSYFKNLESKEYFYFQRGLIDYKIHLPLRNTERLQGLFIPKIDSTLAKFRIAECNKNNYTSFIADPILEYETPDVGDISNYSDFNNNKRHQKLSKLLKENSPEVFTLLKDYYTIPRRISCPTTDWILEPVRPIDKYVDFKDISGTIPWAVYNLSHSLAVTKGMYIAAIDNDCLDIYGGIFAYSINPKKTIVVNNTDVIKSHIMAKSVPSQYRGAYFKKTLQSRDNELGSQKFGIYGLLDEFNSFYYAMRVTIDLLDLYEEEFKLKVDKWLNFFGRTEMIYSSYVEYKIYLLEYLLYCKENKPKIYAKIISNEDFKEAFYQIDKNWAIALNEYEDFKSEVKSYFSDNKIDFKESDKMIQIQNMGIPIKKGYMDRGLKYINSDKFKDIITMLNFEDRSLTY
jgi:hypothetical protein